MTYKRIAKNNFIKLILLCFVLICILLPPRIWRLETLPPIIVDEPANLRDIEIIIKEKNYNIAHQQWDGSQAFFDYYPTVLIQLTTPIEDILSLRIVSVLYSILCVLILFFIMRLYLNTYISFLTAALFSSSYYFLEFSRVGWSAIHALTLGLGGILFTLLSLKKHQIVIPIFGSIACAACFYSYRAGSIYIAACFLIYFFEIIFHKNYRLLRSLFVFTTLFVLLTSPWIYTIVHNWDVYTLRSRTVSIFNAELPYMGYASYLQVFMYQVTSAVWSFILVLPSFKNTGHAENTRYLPLIFPLVSVLLIPFFWIGSFFMIKKIKTFYPFIFIFIAGLITSQVLTVFPPNGARGLIMLPIIYFAIGICLYSIQKKFQKYKWTSYMILIYSMIVFLADILFYFYWMSWIQV